MWFLCPTDKIYIGKHEILIKVQMKKTSVLNEVWSISGTVCKYTYIRSFYECLEMCLRLQRKGIDRICLRVPAKLLYKSILLLSLFKCTKLILIFELFYKSVQFSRVYDAVVTT